MQRIDEKLFLRNQESWTGISPDEFIKFITPKCQEIITLDQLYRMLSENKKLRVKFGIDPTASQIHIGHLAPIMLLKQFVKAGHHIDFIIGDFTARVGDPTERDTARLPLLPDQIAQNMETYINQIGKYIDPTHLNIHYNTHWLNQMTLQEVFTVFQKVNLAEAMQREDFRTRMKNEQAVSLAEVCYGVLMGIDSVHLETNIEIGGIDQLLNFQQCRKVMRQSHMTEEVILMTPILEGTNGDGRKMSKSYGNFVAVNAPPEDKYGKIMSIPDTLIYPYFICFSDIHTAEIKELNDFITKTPLEAKKQLATLLVALETQNLESGMREREAFERKFSQKTVLNEDCITITGDQDNSIFDLLLKSGMFKSKSELRRLFEQNGVREIGHGPDKILHGNVLVGEIQGKVRVGKHRFFQIITQEPVQ